jgi:hypothetical protein
MRVWVKTSIATLINTITQKYVGLTTKGELMLPIGAKKRVAKAPKNFQKRVIGLLSKIF